MGIIGQSSSLLFAVQNFNQAHDILASLKTVILRDDNSLFHRKTLAKKTNNRKATSVTSSGTRMLLFQNV
jgi:hypothetical protein